MSNSVTVRAPARLHLGFLDLNGDIGRRFGSIGLPLREPETVVSLARARETVVEGAEADRAGRHLDALCRHLGLRGAHRLEISESIPAHAGLGSGTQLAIAVSAALRTLHGLPLDVEADALLLDRGGRSGIGIASFAEGGLIVDAGRRIGADGPPQVIGRYAFPEAWRVILVLDSGRYGLHGDAEIEAFRVLPKFPASAAAEICRHVLMGLMPALLERDIAAFGAAVEYVQAHIGGHFAPAQGGLFASRRVETVMQRLSAAGAVGAGQSSWGPTGFAFAASEAAAQAAVSAVGDPGEGIDIRIVAGRNEGAIVAPARLDLVGNR